MMASPMGIPVGESPVLSVLIVTYLSREEIRACLSSIPRTLQGRPVEIIVIENGSGDGIGDIIRSEFPDVIYRDAKANLGFARANNLAWEMSRGEYVLFLNPDTISNERAYLHCLERLQSDASIGTISPKLITRDGSMDLACRRSIPGVWDGFCRATGLASRFPRVKLFAGYNLTYLPENETYSVGSINGAFMMCPRRALLRVGAFDEQFFMYGDDLDLCHRFRMAGYQVVYDGREQIIHLKGCSSSREADRMAKAVFSATKQFYLKHFNPTNSRLTRWKYDLLFGAWERLSSFRAKRRQYRGARPL